MNKFSVGNRVKVKYAGIEGIIVEVNSNTCMISYQNEQDKEIIETYNIADIQKA